MFKWDFLLSNIDVNLSCKFDSLHFVTKDVVTMDRVRKFILGTNCRNLTNALIWTSCPLQFSTNFYPIDKKLRMSFSQENDSKLGFDYLEFVSYCHLGPVYMEKAIFSFCLYGRIIASAYWHQI